MAEREDSSQRAAFEESASNLPDAQPSEEPTAHDAPELKALEAGEGNADEGGTGEFDIVDPEVLDDFDNPMAPLAIKTKLSFEGVTVSFMPVANAHGYKIYRKQGAQGWTAIAHLDDKAGSLLSYTDTDISAGERYSYRVSSLREDYESTCTAESSVNVESLKDPSKVKASKSSTTKNKKKATWSFSWKAPTGASGLELQYADNSLFRGAKYVKNIAATKTSVTVKNLSASKKYYARVRSYVVYGKKRTTGAWQLSSNATKNTSVYPSIITHKVKITVEAPDAKTLKKTVSQVRKGTSAADLMADGVFKVKKSVDSKSKSAKNGKAAKKAKSVKRKTVSVTRPLELRALASQKLYGFDTLQGACTDGTYGYFVLYDRTKTKGKIAKVNLKTKKLVKVSKAIASDHGNGMTYNAVSKRIVIANSRPRPDLLTIVNPKTLKVERVVKLEFPSTLEGATKKQASKMYGVSAIAFDSSRKQLIARLFGSRDFLVLDTNYKAVRYIYVPYKTKQLAQDIEVSGDYILELESAAVSGQWNRVLVYGNDGKFYRYINLRGGMELESAFFYKGKLYTAFYKSVNSVKQGKKAVWKTVRRNYLRVVTDY